MDQLIEFEWNVITTQETRSRGIRAQVLACRILGEGIHPILFVRRNVTRGRKRQRIGKGYVLMHYRATQTLLRSERRDMVFDNLLDFTLNLGGDITLRDLLQQSRLCRGQVRTELTLPFCDLVNRDAIKLCDELEPRTNGR
jgi:hypothetical protein